MGLIDFELDGYDYLTFGILILVVIAFFYVMVTLGGLPGKLAEKRNHPHAESVKLGGWIGLFTVFPWIHALIWAYHDSMTVDVRKLPKNADIETEDGNAPQAGETPAAAGVSAEPQKSSPAGKSSSPEGGASS
ncbi:DUF3302 domain-containing protein [uncultured Roseibium sp.]|uniref:DUF3302 domain-containing protein n=1 Tax=uncultured Roseibium sp. TaxID=1936171 RepID=UPI002631E9C0|nr:DUF3302 domain-containing protein [uncultured Roseibium sp.]